MNLVVDVSVFIDRLFIYSEERSKRARNLFEYIDGKGLGILKPKFIGKTIIDNTGKVRCGSILQS